MTATITSPQNRKTRRRQRTRQQLLDATQKLILEHGYDDSSAEAVAELADLGRSTFYNHFNNKQEAVLAMLTKHYHDYGDLAYIPLEDTPDRAESVARSSLRVFTAMARDPLTRKLIDKPRFLASAIADSQAEFMARDFAEGIVQGRFKFAVSMESMAIVLNWSYVGMLITAINQDSIEETRLEWTRYLLFNLGIPENEIEGLISAALEH